MMYPTFPSEEALPPEKVRFLEVHIEPWPDRRRVRVHVELTPFQQPPNLEFIAENSNEEEVARVNIIEVKTVKLVFTIHLRGPEANGPFTLTSRLYYPDIENGDTHTITFKV